jgi:hypothetical protein
VLGRRAAATGLRCGRASKAKLAGPRASVYRMHSKTLSLLFSEASFEEFCFIFHLYPI